MSLVVPRNIGHTNSFAVFPADCNYHPPMVFGGKMLAEMDRCAADVCRRALYDSPTGARDALTVALDKMTFHKGAKVKDLIFLRGELTHLGVKSMKVKVVAVRETCEMGAILRVPMAEGTFTFVAYDMSKEESMPHGLTLEHAP